MEEVWLGEHHLLGLPEDLGRAAFDQISGQGKGRTGKTNQGNFQLFAQETDGFHDKTSVDIRVGYNESVKGGLVADGFWEDGPMSLREGERGAHGFHGDENVREENSRVYIEDVNGLQGYLYAELRRFTQFQKGHVASYLLIFRKVASSLTHHPDGSVVGLFTAAGFEKGIIHN